MPATNRSAAVFALAAVLANGVIPALAQGRQTGTLRIGVKDPSGAVIPGAGIAIKGTER